MPYRTEWHDVYEVKTPDLTPDHEIGDAIEATKAYKLAAKGYDSKLVIRGAGNKELRLACPHPPLSSEDLKRIRKVCELPAYKPGDGIILRHVGLPKPEKESGGKTEWVYYRPGDLIRKGEYPEGFLDEPEDDNRAAVVRPRLKIE